MLKRAEGDDGSDYRRRRAPDGGFEDDRPMGAADEDPARTHRDGSGGLAPLPEKVPPAKKEERRELLARDLARAEFEAARWARRSEELRRIVDGEK